MEGEGRTCIKIWGVFMLVVGLYFEFGRGRDKHLSWVVVVDEWCAGMNGSSVSVVQSQCIEYGG